MSALEHLRFKLRDSRFGDAFHQTITGKVICVDINEISRYTRTKECWAMTFWIKNLLSGEDVTLDLAITVKNTYKQVSSFITPILADYLKHYHGELDINDISGKDWQCCMSIRRLTRKELETLICDGGEIWEGPEKDDEFSILYHGELLENEECEFDYPLFNLKPDLAKIIKSKRR